MDRLFKCVVSLLGASAVALSAWIAHQYQPMPQSLTLALAMHFIHSLVLLVLVVGYRNTQSTTIKGSFGLFVLGILLFSGSIYAKYLLGVTQLGKLTPFGGLLLIVAWLSLVTVGKKKS